MKIRFTRLPLAALLLAAISLNAADTHPASFRGSELSTEAHWSGFSFPPPGGDPIVNLPFAFNVVDDSDPGTNMFTGGPFTVSADQPYIDVDFTQMTVFLPNWVVAAPDSEIRIQITYNAISNPFTPPTLGTIGGEVGGNPLTDSSVISFSDPQPPVISAPGNFIDNVAVYDITLTPNHDWTSIGFTFNGLILVAVDVDTVASVAVPEPATYALAIGLLVAALVWVRRLLALRE